MRTFALLLALATWGTTAAGAAQTPVDSPAEGLVDDGPATHEDPPATTLENEDDGDEDEDDDEDAEADDVAITLTGFIATTPEEDFDLLMSAFGYADAPRIWGGDATLGFRTLSWLWLGGRLALRSRAWNRNEGDPATALGVAGLAVAEGRLRIDTDIELVPAVGLGAGGVSLQLNDDASVHPSPTAHVGLGVVFALGRRMYGVVRLAWDYLEAVDFDAAGHDVNLSGVSFAVGVEGRP